MELKGLEEHMLLQRRRVSVMLQEIGGMKVKVIHPISSIPQSLQCLRK